MLIIRKVSTINWINLYLHKVVIGLVKIRLKYWYLYREGEVKAFHQSGLLIGSYFGNHFYEFIHITCTGTSKIESRKPALVSKQRLHT